MLSLMARANADNVAFHGQLTDDDRLGLRATLAQMDAMSSRIRQVLGDDDVAATPAPPTIKAEAEASSPFAGAESLHGLVAHKADVVPVVTEPTPPSTVDHADGSMDLD